MIVSPPKRSRVFAQVHAIRADSQGEVDVVIDDKQGVVATTQCGNRVGFSTTARAIFSLVAILNSTSAAAQRGSDDIEQIDARSVGDGIQPAYGGATI